MLKETYYVDVVKSFIPDEGALVTFEYPHSSYAMWVRDLDMDGRAEIIAHYNYKNSLYCLILKQYYDKWNIMSNYKVIPNITAYREKIIKSVNLYPARVRGAHGEKWGYIDNEGKFMIDAIYDNAYDFQSNGLANVTINNKVGLIDSTGRYVVDPIYDSISGFTEARASVIDKDGFKLIDEKGNVLTSKAYSYIGSFNNGRAVFNGTLEKDKSLYGYLDRQGREVIPLKYESANDFNAGKAVVKAGNKSFQLIDLNGKVINNYNYNFVGDLREGLLPFQKNDGDKYGYIHENETIAIVPRFTMALPFKGGRAIVNTGEDYKSLYGVIDKAGNVVINPEFNEIDLIGQERIAVGKAIDAEKPYYGSRFSIADINGKFLTDFIYTSVSDYAQGFASASDEKNTFFIDRSGRMAKTLPVVSGYGSLTFVGKLIKSYVDNRLAYYNKNGDIVWRENNIIKLNDQYRIMEIKFKPNKDYLVYYPKIEGMKDLDIQENVNKKLKTLSEVKPIDSNIQLDYSYVGDFIVEFFKKDLLVLELDGYHFPFGAAHGMPTKIYPHVNLTTGRFYELKDLFKKDSNYVKILSDIIGEQIKNNPEYSYVFPDSYKGIVENQPFYVDENNLYIYFAPYEIGPYAAGFPTFKIPFREIKSIIDTNGEFWLSFN